MAFEQTLALVRGNSSDVFRLGVKKYVMDDTWTCKAIVIKEFGSERLINKAATFDSSEKIFKTLITPAESASLEEGDYILVFVFENQAQFFKKELQYKLRVTQSGSI